MPLDVCVPSYGMKRRKSSRTSATSGRIRLALNAAAKLKRSPNLGQPELENSGVMKRSPNLGQPELENSGVRAHSGGDAGEPFMSAIGGLLPIALCGRTSL